MADVANFVEVATSTTGEGDYYLERLSLLHSVATGYSSLIFDVDHNIGFIELCNKCQGLWKELEENPQLPEYLVSLCLHVCVHKRIYIHACTCRCHVLLIYRRNFA